jgi:hypothetical protein
MKPRISMREALAEKALLGSIMSGTSRYSWRVLLIAAAGEELTDDERVEFKKLTGREREPGVPCRELACASGRRSGKSSALAAYVTWIAALCDHRSALAPGEQGIVLVISRDQRASRVTLDYVSGLMRVSPFLSLLIANQTADSIELTNGISLEMRPCNKVSVRGISCVAVICDELSFWYTESSVANPDTEILAAVKPTLLTTNGPLLMASSVYAKRGVLYDYYKRYYGPTGPADVIVAYATSRDLNPSLPQELIDLEIEKDPTRNRAEYLSEFRSDVDGFIPREIVESCVGDYFELPPNPSLSYRLFVDPSSGVNGGDSFGMCIAHKLGDRIVVDAIREAQPPFSPSDVISNILVPLARSYFVTSATGDGYAGEYPRELFRTAGIAYELSKKHKSELYVDPFLPLLSSKKIDLPRNDRLISQICNLERNTQKSGRDQITHPPHGHDDLSNAVAGAVDVAYNFSLFDASYAWVSGPVAPAETDEQRKERHRRESEDWYRHKLRNYLAANGAFGAGPPWGRL